MQSGSQVVLHAHMNTLIRKEHSGLVCKNYVFFPNQENPLIWYTIQLD